MSAGLLPASQSNSFLLVNKKLTLSKIFTYPFDKSETSLLLVFKKILLKDEKSISNAVKIGYFTQNLIQASFTIPE